MDEITGEIYNEGNQLAGNVYHQIAALTQGSSRITYGIITSSGQIINQAREVVGSITSSKELGTVVRNLSGVPIGQLTDALAVAAGTAQGTVDAAGHILNYVEDIVGSTLTSTYNFISNVGGAIAGLFGKPIPSPFNNGLEEVNVKGEIAYNLLDVDASIGAQLITRSSFQPGDVEVKMKASTGQIIKGHLGDSFEFDTPAGEGELHVVAKYTLGGILTIDLGLRSEGVVTAKGLNAALAATAFGETFDVHLLDGPLLNESFVIPGTSAVFWIPGATYSTTASLGHSKSDFTIKYENFVEGSDNDDDVAFTSHQEQLMLFAGDDTAVGNALANVIFGGSGSDSISGAEGEDSLFGNSGKDFLSGGGGSDVLYGGSDGDQILGQGGPDSICGGPGGDMLDGGTGRNIFVYRGFEDSFDTGLGSESETVDVISRFGSGDRIDVSSIDADVTLKGDQSFQFIGGDEFVGKGGIGQIRIVQGAIASELLVLVDIDANGMADMMIRVESASISNDNFVL